MPSIVIVNLKIKEIEGMKGRKRGYTKKISVIQCIWCIIRYMNSINLMTLIVIDGGPLMRDLIGPSP